MTAIESQQYDLGRQARRAGYPKDACNLMMMNPLRSWWLAGWHDEDMEMIICAGIA
jgi:ribosome modulation factor